MEPRSAYEQAADRAVTWLAARLEDDGSYGDDIGDLACYYKSPYLFQLSGRAREAARIMGFIDRRFRQQDGDFVTSADQKSDNAAFNEYWAYCQATGDAAHLETARGYLDVALGCRGNLRSFYFSHKVAWGAALLAGITSDRRCIELARDIADHLLGIQDPSGAWLVDQPSHTTFDQTAEIAIWLKEISAELDRCP